ncbi:hypothetical protein D0864_01192 [Hortaea werneckii]|uniref:Uncharacterized protein n=1 Tax=Hortaea werneckii TaxID=91943 RepID=A0A3M7HCM1_HORWE|nr:hypothetical protein D0864_01192 [Hortaea werneckii]
MYKLSKEYQRMAWGSLKKSINGGLISMGNVSNINEIVPELLNERGLFCTSIMKAQAASLPFSPVLAATAAVVNTKLPQIGELLVNGTALIAHLINQQVAHEMLAAQMLLLLLHKPTYDSVEIAVGLVKEVGMPTEDIHGQIALAIAQYMIEVLFKIRKDKYKDHQAIRGELDLVEEEIRPLIVLAQMIKYKRKMASTSTTTIRTSRPTRTFRNSKAEILGEVSGREENHEDASDESSEEEEDQAEKAVTLTL